MAHEHLLKAHISPHIANDDTPFKNIVALLYYYIRFVTSRRFQKWCSSGVVSAFPLHESIDFTGFFRTFQVTALADEQDFYHTLISPYI